MIDDLVYRGPVNEVDLKTQKENYKLMIDGYKDQVINIQDAIIKLLQHQISLVHENAYRNYQNCQTVATPLGEKK